MEAMSDRPSDIVDALDDAIVPSVKGSTLSSRSCKSKKSKKERIKIQAELTAAKAKAELEAEEIHEQLEFQRRERERDRLETELRKRSIDARKKIIEEELALQKSKMDEEDSGDSQFIGSDGSDDEAGSEHDTNMAPSNNKGKQNREEETNNIGNDKAKNVEEKDEVEGQKKGQMKEGKKDKMDVFLSRQMMEKELPKFDGNPEEWPGFISQFRQSTEDCELTNNENMSRLRKCLKGKAKEAVQALLVLPQNVDRVISTLEQRFGRADYIVRAFIEKAKRIPPPKDEKWDSILDFANVVQNLTVTLEMLKCQGHLMNPQLLEELVSKLPYHLRFEWGKKVEEGKRGLTTLTEFSEWLESVATAASWVHVPKYVPEDNHDRKIELKKGRRYRKDETVLTTHDQTSEKPFPGTKSGNNKSYKCLFCDLTGHLSKDCRNFKNEDVEHRWKQVVEKRLCFSCLIPGHTVRDCRRKKTCGLNECKSFHNPLLHKMLEDKSNATEPKETPGRVESIVHTLGQVSTIKVMLRVAPVVLKGPSGEVETYALFDEAATVTLLGSEVAKRLGLSGPKEALCLQWTNELTRKELNSQTVTLGISGVGNNPKSFRLTNVRTVDGLSLPTQSVDMDKMSTEWSYLKNLNVRSIVNAHPTILIGQDNALLTVARKVIHGPLGAPMASKTWLGWVVHGPERPRGKVDNQIALHMCHYSDNDPLHELVKESFSTESFGVKVIRENPRSKEDCLAESIMEATTKRVDNRFETGLLWRNEKVTLPNSKNNALKRLLCIEQKMDKNPDFGQQYKQKIDEYLKKGYIKELNEEESKKEGPRTWYLPHFAVYNANKPGKLRLVFDAAARSSGVSLNDYLLKGPDLTAPLYAVLLKFRQKRIGFAGDIKEMFHQVRIRDCDTDAQRLLWRGNDRDANPTVYEVKVMIFGATCSPSSAQYVKNHNAEEYRDEFPEVYKAIVDRHYVDDYLDGADSENEAAEMIKKVTEIHRKGGFEIRNWIASSKRVLDDIPEDSRAEGLKSFDTKANLFIGRVLGMWWNPESDAFNFRMNFPKVDADIINASKRPTKREVLGLVMSVFDPIGFLAQLTIKAKIMLQDIWRCGIGWDDEITEELYGRWKKWTKELKEIVHVNIPRCYSANLSTADEIQLHLYCDASEKAFCAVAYLRVRKGEHVDVAFVTAKTRVSPLKPMSIPRLELQGAVMASRLSCSVQESLEVDISETHFWTDSKTLLSWIRAEARSFKPFVAHRIGEIQELTDTHRWHWIPTLLNVADDATRDCKPCDFSSESRWFTGPPFLKLSVDKWPMEEFKGKEINGEEQEEQSEFVAVLKNVVDVFPDVTRFSKYQRLIRATAWLKRFINNLKARVLHSVHSETGQLSPYEIEKAEEAWWLRVQHDSFSDELRLLTQSKELPKKSRIYSLTPIIDENGVMRLKGRTAMAVDLDDWAKNPVILDQKHPFTRLLVHYFHEKIGHHGHETVLNELRQKFWVISARAAVKRACSSCQTCKIRKARPERPEMGQLPAARVTGFVAPFTYTGIDYFGPMEVVIGRRREKRYGVLFTCLSIRAVHLEIASSLTTDSAIMAIRRMIGRRGSPKELFSDNGTNLRGANVELRKALKELDQEKITTEMTSRAIKWHFIPPSAPHMGGSWERLVQSVKTALSVTLNERTPKEEVLQTLMVEAENIVNSRPLTHVSVDPLDPVSLTPNHFLLRSSNGNKPPGIFDDGDLCLRAQWRIAQRLSDIFWKRWIKEYLPTLTRRTKDFRRTNPLKIGDIVIIADGSEARNSWPMGRVTDVFPGRDGVVRVVDVKTVKGIYRRPVAKLCVLDVNGALEGNDGHM